MSKRAFFILPGLVLLAIAALVMVIVVKFSSDKPIVKFSKDISHVGRSLPVTLKVVGQKSGLKDIKVILRQGKKEEVFFHESFPSKGFFKGSEVLDKEVTFKINSLEKGFEAGPAELITAATDHSWRGGFKGNLTEIVQPVIVVTKPPVITVLSPSHYVNKGGAGLVVYQVTGDPAKTGVMVGQLFFQGYSIDYLKAKEIAKKAAATVSPTEASPKAGASSKKDVDAGKQSQANGEPAQPESSNSVKKAIGSSPAPVEPKVKTYAAFFALPYNAVDNEQLAVIAQDYAGNEAKASFWHKIFKVHFRQDRVTVSEKFITNVINNFQDLKGAPTGDPVKTFLWINKDLRKESNDRIEKVCSTSNPQMLWEGTFLRMKRSDPKALFADSRTYLYNGQVIDQQVHLGQDLASLTNSPVEAGNNGIVVFTGDLGIYGQTVILDHGMGVFSSYSHLSRIDVNKGDRVTRGVQIAVTGSTGLAGGDHLHYGMMVGTTFVNPKEWWDAKWIKDNIYLNLKSFVQTPTGMDASADQSTSPPATQKSEAPKERTKKR
ncbi:MAG: M23 family metallopeptidase [Deltaproteobacteria bacterium]|nr:M23 family metallopeptidase [Deltaproteobacteria bacterium]